MAKIMIAREFINQVCKAYGIDPKTVRAVHIDAEIDQAVHVTFTHLLPQEFYPQVMMNVVKPDQEEPE